MDIQEITNLWTQDEPKYKELGILVHGFIKENISEIELLPEVSQRTKDLLSIIKKIKKKKSEKEYGYNDLNDKLGVRIICTFQDELQPIDLFLKKYFIIRKVEYKREELDFKKLDYTSNHYDLSIKPEIFQNAEHLTHLIFETQVRTLNQHSWSNTAHSLSYKQEADISPLLQRRVYRLLSLYEIADDEFSSVNQILTNNNDNPVYQLLRKTEGKIYKFAKVDFDRSTALSNIRVIISYLNGTEQKELQKNIESFININNQKIQNIFDENRIRFHEIPFITQPDVFIIWYCLEKFFYQIFDNWDKDFDIADLEQISTLWGKSLY